MPASIAREIGGNSQFLNLVFPGTIYAIQFFDPDEDSNDVVVVGCDRGDSMSDIFLFETPGGYDAQDGPDTLLDHCSPENLLSQIGHKDEFHISVNLPTGEAAKFIIAHSVLHSLN